MIQSIRNRIWSSDPSSLARAFRRLGWAGFWVQLVLGSLSIIFMAYHLVFARKPAMSRSGVPFIEYLTIANLLVLAFTIYWSYHYTRLGAKIVDPQQRPTESRVLGAVWTGVAASTAGILCSMLVLLIETAALLFFFLRAPQGGIPVVQTGGQDAYWVSSVDMVSLVALVLTCFAEVLVLVFSLWLLLRVTTAARGVAPAAQDTPIANVETRNKPE